MGKKAKKRDTNGRRDPKIEELKYDDEYSREWLHKKERIIVRMDRCRCDLSEL